MGLFDKELSEIREFLAGAETHPRRHEYRQSAPAQWPRGMGKSVVLSQDTAVELGNPRDESCSFLVWDDDPGRVRDGAITLIGPELSECDGKSVPFGKIVIIGAEGFNEDNSYDRYREMDLVRYDLDLMGYMLRAASQYQREWSRIGKEALRQGFTFRVLGGALMDAFRKKEYVKSVEIIFVTTSREDILKIRPISESAMKIISAMGKMLEELEYDCGTCEHTAVCNDVADLRKMRDKLAAKEGGKECQLKAITA